MPEPTEVVAIIKTPRYGCTDHGHVGLMFTVHLPHGTCADLFLPAEEANALIREHGIEDIAKLEGKPCFVERRNHTVDFKRLWVVGK